MQIIQGDCLEELAKIKEDFVIVTDPPFNIGYHYSGYKDNMEEDEYYSWLAEVFKFAPFVCIHYPESLYKLSWKVEEIPEKVISWVYNSNTAKQHRDIAFFGIKPDFRKLGQPFKNPRDKRIMKRISDGKQARGYDWWNINQVKNVSKDKTSHPCQMPVEIMENIIKLIPVDKLIVDPFAGSGTTGVACQNLKRDFILIEKEPKYVEIIKRKGTKANIEANRILKQRWIERGLCWCEIRLPGCLGNYLLQNVHRNKRWVYKGKVELLTQDSEVVLGCQNCHNQIEDNKTLREEIFNKLRVNE